MFNPYLILFWLGSLLLATGAGWQLRGDHQAGQRLDQVEQVQKASVAVQDVVDHQAQDHAEQSTRQAQKDRVIYKEVIRYEIVTQPAGRCNLPGTWRVRHDAAATGDLPESPSLADAAAEPVADAAALATVADNYTACRGYIDQVAGWQAFWVSVKDACRGEL